MNYPLSLRFKLLALAPQIFLEDASSGSICYVKQKLFKLREKVEVFQNSSRQELLCTISADRIIDWSARYRFTDPTGQIFGKLGRRGMKSIWSAHYDVFDPEGKPTHSIREENPWSKVGDSLLGGIPVIGLASSYLFHPQFLATRADGTPVMRLTKQPAFFEGRFKLEKLAEMTPTEELTILMSYLMLLLLERQRG